ncbi:MAG TPA: hypothetical protein VGG06_35085 [Thermoanaerobaculia bacterium]|jgi:hypothetical protein
MREPVKPAKRRAGRIRDRIHDTPGDEHYVKWMVVADPASPHHGERWPHVFGSLTVDFIAASPTAVLEAVYADWNVWWRHGKMFNRRPVKDPFTDAVVAFEYTLAPLALAGKPLASIEERMAAPRELTGDELAKTGWTNGKVFRLDIDASGSFLQGPVRWEIRELEDGASQVIVAVDGVRPQGIYRFIPKVHMTLHVRSHSGSMPLCLRGSGLPGLIRLLEADTG